MPYSFIFLLNYFRTRLVKRIFFIESLLQLISKQFSPTTPLCWPCEIPNCHLVIQLESCGPTLRAGYICSSPTTSQDRNITSPNRLMLDFEPHDCVTLLNYPAMQKQSFQVPNIPLEKENHGHVDSLFLFVQCHNPKGKEVK